MFGIFDSGVGGLSVFRLLKEAFPEAGFIYLGDTAHFPYGEKSTEAIRDYAYKNTQFLLEKGAKVIVIACHTASALAADYLRTRFKDVPIYDVINPTIKQVLNSEIKRLGVIGTRATIDSKIYERKLKLKGKHIWIFPKACPLLVSLIEEGWVKKPETFSILKYYLSPLANKKIESLILSCTHYSLIESTIKKILDPRIEIIEPAKVLTKTLIIELDKTKTNQSNKDTEEFWVTDYPLKFEKLSKLFLGKKIKVQLLD